MSFLGGSECAANANPLAQLNKHSQTDNSLQHTLREGHLTQSGAFNPLHRQNVMNAQDQQQMNSFMSGKSQDNFDFHPMRQEINMMSQYREPLMQQPQPTFELNTAPMATKSNNWTNEFITNSPVNQSPIVQNQPSMINASQVNGNHMVGMNHRMNMMPSMLTHNHMMHSMNSTASMSQQSQKNDSIQEVTQDWEDQFKEIEDQVNLASEVEMEQATSALDEMNQALREDQVHQGIADDYLKLFSERPNDKYKFEDSNEFLHNPNAYEIGCRLMEGGAKLSEASLAFEAAVQEDPRHVDAWLKLGECQIQNEKELLGITALENCLNVDPRNLKALMSLAISYVNEGYDNAAFKSFEKWIENKYPDVVSQARNEANSTSDDRFSLNKRVTNLFLRAAQLSPSGANMDADVQTGLGVLFYSMEEYDKTLDCFQAAIRCDPNDALLWNRLGASYANSNRPEQAIEAYSKALQLNPNFVRARYNLGVSFINMGMYNDAVDHLLTGLSMHEVESPEGNGTFVSDTEQSGSLIETLKRAFLAMNRRDLIDKVRPGMNVEKFKNDFNF